MPGAIAMGAELCAILEDDLAVIQALLQRPKRVQLMRMRGLFAAISFRSRSSGAEKRTFVLVEGLMYAPCLRMSRSSSVISACSSRGDPVMRESTQLARRCCFSLYPLMRVKAAVDDFAVTHAADCHLVDAARDRSTGGIRAGTGLVHNVLISLSGRTYCVLA